MRNNNNNIKYLEDLLVTLSTTARTGSSIDIPEGSKVITISDTLTKEICSKLNDIIKDLKSNNFSYKETWE